MPITVKAAFQEVLFSRHILIATFFPYICFHCRHYRKKKFNGFSLISSQLCLTSKSQCNNNKKKIITLCKLTFFSPSLLLVWSSTCPFPMQLSFLQKATRQGQHIKPIIKTGGCQLRTGQIPHITSRNESPSPNYIMWQRGRNGSLLLTSSVLLCPQLLDL